MNAQQTATSTHQVKMFANLEQNLFIPLTGTDPKAVAVSVHAKLKGMNARIGLDRVMALISGQEEMFKGYELVDIATHNNHVKSEFSPEKAEITADPKTEKNPELQISKNVGARGRGRNYEPFSGRKWIEDPEAERKVVPLKKGTLGTRCMEFMLRPEGATLKYMMEQSGNKTPGGINDILGWQIKEKGYGVRFDTANGTYHLVLPKGQKELIYA